MQSLFVGKRPLLPRGYLFRVFGFLDFLSLNKGFFEEVEVLEINAVCDGQAVFRRLSLFVCFLYVLAQRFILFLVVPNEFFVLHFQSVRQFNRDFLLFKENKLVVLHVVFRISFQIRS